MDRCLLRCIIDSDGLWVLWWGWFDRWNLAFPGAFGGLLFRPLVNAFFHYKFECVEPMVGSDIVGI